MSSSPVNTPLKGLVLAGGKGTRLRPLTHTMAKQLVPVANKPILHYAFQSLYDAGVRDIGVIISPETGDAIQASANLWKPEDATLTYILQDAPSGLAHAVAIAQPFLGDSPFIMYLGDNLIQNPLQELVTSFHQDPCDAMILLKAVENPQSFGVAVLDDQQQVVSLEEKPAQPKSNLALVGVYLFTPLIFDAIAQIKPSPRGELEITDAIDKLIQLGHSVRACQVEGWWLDTGKKDDLLEANRIVLDAYAEYLIDGDVDEASQCRGRVQVGAGTIVRNSIIQGPVAIGSGCVIEDAYIGPFSSIGDQSIIRHSELDNCVLLERCHIEGIPARIEQSLFGQDCQLIRNLQPPAAYRFMLGDQSVVEVL